MSEPQSGAEILARIKPQLAEDWVEVCLRPDLLTELEEVGDQLAESTAKDSEGNRLTSGRSKRTVELAEQVQSIEAQISESAVRFTFRAMTRDEFRKLADRNPPRKGNQYDGFAGYNVEAVGDAMTRACLVDPVFDDEAWRQLVDVLSPSEWQALAKTAEKVNGRVVTDPPKSLLASQILSAHASASRPQPASA